MEMKLKFILQLLLNISVIILCLVILNGLNNKNFENIIDFDPLNEIKDCFLQIHNFVSLNTTLDITTTNGSIGYKFDKNSNDQNFKTYIQSYSRPFILELIQNGTQDCVCCT